MHHHCHPASRLIAAFTASLVLSAAALAAQPAATGSARAEQVRALNAKALKLQSDSRRLGAKAVARSKPEAVLASRAKALQELIASDPAAAEQVVFPAKVLAQLAETFPKGTASLEERGRWDGEIEYLIEDGANLSSHRAIYRLHRGRESFDLGFARGEPPGLRSGQRASIGGVRSGRALLATDVQITDAAQDGTGSTSGTASYPAQCAATGPQSVLAVLVNLPSYSLPSGMTPDFVRGVLLGNAYGGTSISTTDWSVSDFWAQNSDGKTFVDPVNSEVVGPIRLASNFNTNSTGASYCDYPGLGTAVINALDSQVDFKRYSRIKIVMPGNGACTWAGVANVGCRSLSSPGDGTFTASMAWQRASTMGSRSSAVQLTTHELGHNLGMSHAASRAFSGEPLGAVGATGTLSEYGDSHSTMGSWNFGFYAASHAANQLRWLGQGSNYLVVESPGTYTIQNYEARPAGVKALKVRRGTGNDAWLWIESRQNTGIYSSRLNSSLFTGALIRYQDSQTGGRSHLLDFTPGTTGFSDAPLQAGQTWTDPYSNVSVTVNSVQPSAMTVTVNYGALPCVPAAPTVTLSPSGTATEYGASATFNVSVKSNSSTGCPADAVSLDATVPSGWSKGFGSAMLTVNPGQTAQTALTVGVPFPYALGTYPVSAAAAAGTRVGTGTQSVTVIEPVNRLTLTFAGSGGGTVTFSSPAKSCTSSCVTDYPKSFTPTVTLTAKPASKVTFGGWSGACSGTATTCSVPMTEARSVTATFNRSSGSTTKKPSR